MKLSDAKPRDTVIVIDLSEVPLVEQNVLRDMGLYEMSVIHVDENKNGEVVFHKDAGPLKVSARRSEKICISKYKSK